MAGGGCAELSRFLKDDPPNVYNIGKPPKQGSAKPNLEARLTPASQPVSQPASQPAAAQSPATKQVYGAATPNPQIPTSNAASQPTAQLPASKPAHPTVDGPEPVGPDPLTLTIEDGWEVTPVRRVCKDGKLEMVTKRMNVPDIIRAAMIYHNLPMEYTDKDWQPVTRGRGKKKKIVYTLQEIELNNLAIYLSLASIESAFRWDVVSRAGAAGFKQFIPVTARHAFNQLSKKHCEISLDDMVIYNPEFHWRKRVSGKGRKKYELVAYNLLPTVDRSVSGKKLARYGSALQRFRDRQRVPIDKLDKQYYRQKVAEYRGHSRKRVVMARSTARHSAIQQTKELTGKQRQMMIDLIVKQVIDDYDKEFKDKRAAAEKEYSDKRNELEREYYRKMRAADARFDMFYNPVMSIDHFRELLGKYTGKPIKYVVKTNGHYGSVVRNFQGATALGIAAIAYNMGPRNMAYGLVKSKYTHLGQYFARACRLGNGFCGNRRYVQDFMTNRRLFTTAIRNRNLTPEFVQKNLKWGGVLAKNLFRAYDVTLPKSVYERLEQDKSREQEKQKLKKELDDLVASSGRRSDNE